MQRYWRLGLIEAFAWITASILAFDYLETSRPDWWLATQGMQFVPWAAAYLLLGTTLATGSPPLTACLPTAPQEDDPRAALDAEVFLWAGLLLPFFMGGPRSLIVGVCFLIFAIASMLKSGELFLAPGVCALYGRIHRLWQADRRTEAVEATVWVALFGFATAFALPVYSQILADHLPRLEHTAHALWAFRWSFVFGGVPLASVFALGRLPLSGALDLRQTRGHGDTEAPSADDADEARTSGAAGRQSQVAAVAGVIVPLTAFSIDTAVSLAGLEASYQQADSAAGDRTTELFQQFLDEQDRKEQADFLLQRYPLMNDEERRVARRYADELFAAADEEHLYESLRFLNAVNRAHEEMGRFEEIRDLRRTCRRIQTDKDRPQVARNSINGPCDYLREQEEVSAQGLADSVERQAVMETVDGRGAPLLALTELETLRMMTRFSSLHLRRDIDRDGQRFEENWTGRVLPVYARARLRDEPLLHAIARLEFECDGGFGVAAADACSEIGWNSFLNGDAATALERLERACQPDEDVAVEHVSRTRRARSLACYRLGRVLRAKAATRAQGIQSYEQACNLEDAVACQAKIYGEHVDADKAQWVEPSMAGDHDPCIAPEADVARLVPLCKRANPKACHSYAQIEHGHYLLCTHRARASGVAEPKAEERYKQAAKFYGFAEKLGHAPAVVNHQRLKVARLILNEPQAQSSNPLGDALSPDYHDFFYPHARVQPRPGGPGREAP